MQEKILHYRKTSHFLYRQWDRCIDDDFLKAVLTSAKASTTCPKVNIIISSQFIREAKSLGIRAPKCSKYEFWILTVRYNLLITIYKSSNPDLLAFIKLHKRQEALIV